MTNPPIGELDDLLVHVIELDPIRQTYIVKMTLEGGRNFSGQMDLEDYQDPSGGSSTSIASYGINLFNRLFPGPLSDAFRQAWAVAQARKRGLRLRLRLDSNNPRLHRIPWELIYYDDSGGLSPPRPLAVEGNVAFSRYLESSEPEGEPIAHRPVRMLVAIAEPSDLENWNLASFGKTVERRDLENRFSPLINSGQFIYDFLDRVSPQRLHRALEQGTQQDDAGVVQRGYDVLLYYGHALHHPDRGTRLLLEDDATGEGYLYDASELVNCLQRLNLTPQRVRMVVLVACNTATMATERSLGNLAAALVQTSGVPAVLAMQRLVEIPLARSFTYYLSDYLLRNGVIDVAVNTARRRVYQPDSLSWSTPVLYMRIPDGRLFSPNARLEYVQAVLSNTMFTAWRGPEYIDLEVIAVPPGQDWSLLKYHPEDAPPTVSGLRAIKRLLQAKAPDPTPNLIWLLGPPRSGQTVLLRRLMLELADAVLQDINQPLGIFVSLSGYEQQRGSNRLARHVFDRASELVATIGEELLRNFQRPIINAQRPEVPAPRYVFILDGLDAIPDQQRVEANREIIALAAQFPDQRFIVSCSEDRFPGITQRQAPIFLLQPLSERLVQHYLRNRNPTQSTALFRQIVENRLLALTTDPSLLGLIYDRLAVEQVTSITRNQLVQDYLDQALIGVAPRYTLGDAARETLIALAWQSRWQHRQELSLQEMYAIMRQVRGERDYDLEELYQMLSTARLLVGIGRHMVRFVHPALHSYAAALALNGRRDSDFSARLQDIITMCSSPERYAWWEDTLYGLAGLLTDPTPLLESIAGAVRSGSNIHTLIAARCLEALPIGAEPRLPTRIRQQLIDACVLRLRDSREPQPDRRAQIATALGRLDDTGVIQELKRMLIERVRTTSRGPRYEYTNVRIAAARALRTMLTRKDYAPTATGTATPATQPQTAPEEQPNATPDCQPVAGGVDDLVDDAILRSLMFAWQSGEAGRAELRKALCSSVSAPVRAVAAFALGDLAAHLLDAKLLLRVIFNPRRDVSEQGEDWEDTMWAAADALTLFEPESVARMLRVLIKRHKEIPHKSAQQLAYLAGRVRAQDEAVIDWLIRLLICNPAQGVKSKAMQALAWQGKSLQSRTLPGVDGQPGLTVKQVIENIAAWRPIPRTSVGEFIVEQTEEDLLKTPLYLRRKALESLIWIGDRQTLQFLERDVSSWDIELREVWYATAATLEARLSHTTIMI